MSLAVSQFTSNTHTHTINTNTSEEACTKKKKMEKKIGQKWKKIKFAVN